MRVKGNQKRNNLCIMGVPEEEEREIKTESLFKEIMDENIPNLRGHLDIKFLRLIGPQTNSIQRDLFQDTL